MTPPRHMRPLPWPRARRLALGGVLAALFAAAGCGEGEGLGQRGVGDGEGGGDRAGAAQPPPGKLTALRHQEATAAGARLAARRRGSSPTDCLLDTLDGRFIEGVFAERCPALGLGLRESLTLAILEEAAALGLDPLLLLGLIQVESRFDPLARSNVGARGLDQLRPATARHQADLEALAQTDAELDGDPEWQHRLGARYLAELLARFKKLDLALIAYNAGPTKLQRLLGRREGLSAYEGYPRAVLAQQARFAAERADFAARWQAHAFQRETCPGERLP